ncbi:MAG: peptide-methionine (S)-S-oxide reductase MsrA [Alkalispirochaeta sp.]
MKRKHTDKRNERRRPKRLLLWLVVALPLTVLPAVLQAAPSKTAIFGGGCFWCMEGPFDKLDGVVSTTSGFSGGHVPDPSYQQVTQGTTGHREVVRIIYDPDRVSYEELLYVYWRNVDPMDGTGQFCDRGDTYAPVIYTVDSVQADLARISRRVVGETLDAEIAVEIHPFEAFYPAEDYHQDYYINNPLRYRFYRSRCGRDRRLETVWGDEALGEHPEPWLPTNR